MKKVFPYTFGGLLIGFVIGLILGFVAGAGESNYYKKSQRDFAAPVLSIIGGVVFGITGAGLGYKLGNELGKERKLGIDKAVTTYDKQGRYWIGQTVWQGQDGVGHKITTKKALTGELTSTYNENAFLKHGTNSGSLVNVRKAHQSARYQVYNSLKSMS